MSMLPPQLAVPSGRHVFVDYSTGRPVVSVKLQECFGLAESPMLCRAAGAVPTCSPPAGRPLAVTDDLGQFLVRAVFPGPRGHAWPLPQASWPEDPWSAEATGRVKGRGKR